MKNFVSPSRRVAFFAAALVLLTFVWLLAWKKPLGRDNWFIAPHEFWPINAFLFPLGVLVILGGFAAMSAYDRSHRAKTRREEIMSLRMSLGALVLFATLWPWSLLGPRAVGGYSLVAATWSDISNQYFSTAYEIDDAREFTRNYGNWQRSPDITKAHVATHPPGAVLFYFAARRIYENVPLVHNAFTTLAPGITAASTQSVAETVRAELRRSNAADANSSPLPDDAVPSALWCAFLLTLCVGATVPAVYKLAAGESSTRSDETSASDTSNDETRTRETRGLLAAALFAAAPVVSLFAFTLDALLAFLVAWSLLLISRRVTSGSQVGIISALASGALLGLASFVSFGALAVWGLLVFAFALGFGWRSLLTTPQFVLTDLLSRRKPLVHRPFSDLLLLLASFVGLWILLSLIFPMQPQLIYERAMQAHHDATLTTRSHAGWALLNVFVFALFCGWPLIALIFVAARAQFRVWRKHGAVEWNAARVLGVAALLLCVVLSLSGNVRGETERLWFFLMPPLCALGANALITDSTRDNEYSILGTGRLAAVLIALQIAQTVLMAGSLAPLVRSY